MSTNRGAPQPDSSALSIVLMNMAVLVGALLAGEGPLWLMWPYWIQSMVIGYYNVRRIQKLQRFSTSGLKINGASVEPTPATRRQTWTFFTAHYGIFHFGYAMFLVTYASNGFESAPPSGGSDWDWLWYVVAFVGFLVSHGQSHREHVAADLKGTPNVGTLMFMPYLRIIPMHLTIIFGSMLGGGRLALLMFGLLKTAADVAMHKVEHYVLQQGAATRAG